MVEILTGAGDRKRLCVGRICVVEILTAAADIKDFVPGGLCGRRY